MDRVHVGRNTQIAAAVIFISRCKTCQERNSIYFNCDDADIGRHLLLWMYNSLPKYISYANAQCNV